MLRLKDTVIVIRRCKRLAQLFFVVLIGSHFLVLQAQEQNQIQSEEVSQYQHWLNLMAADQSFADRSAEIGRTAAFLEFLGQGSTVFRDGPVDALELYASEEFQDTANEINW